MSPTVHIVCEAECPSLSPVDGRLLRDPTLTDTGVLQSQRIRDTFPHMNKIKAIFSSPLKRAIQTAQIAFRPTISPSLQVSLVRNLLGAGGSPKTTGSLLEELTEEFGLDVNLKGLKDGWWFNPTNDIHNFSPDLAYDQARQVRLYIREVAARLGVNFVDGEYRSYQFANLSNDDKAAHLVEARPNSSSSSLSGTTLVSSQDGSVENSSNSSDSSQATPSGV